MCISFSVKHQQIIDNCYKSGTKEKQVDAKITTLSEQIKKLPINSSKIAQLLISHKANSQRNNQNRPKNY